MEAIPLRKEFMEVREPNELREFNEGAGIENKDPVEGGRNEFDADDVVDLL